MNDNTNNRKPISTTTTHYSARQYYKDNLRVLRKNLLFCSGLPLSLTEDDIKSKQYFGKYGKVTKVIMLKNIRQMSVYVTYSDVYQASLAIIVIVYFITKATNDAQIDRYHKLASIYGTIKYCKYFLKKIECKNMPNCNYLHVYDKKNQIYIDNQLPDEVFQEHYRIALKLLKQINLKTMAKQKNFVINTSEDILPCPIEALNRIGKQKAPCSAKYIEVVNSQQSSCSQSQQNDNQSQKSQQQTSQTIVTQNSMQPSCAIDYLKQQFPKLLVSEPLVKKQKQNSSINSCRIQKFIQKSKSKQGKNQGQQNQPQKQQFIQKKQKNLSNNQQNQSLQIKLIRKLVRQQKSKLNLWTDYEKNREQYEQINLFHRQLSQLNQLKAICQSNILKQINKEQERLKFMLIKNIHHKKHQNHHHQLYYRDSSNNNQNNNNIQKITKLKQPDQR